jgi:hypothetical protein
MRAVFGIISLLIVLLIVGGLVKKQMAATIAPISPLSTPAANNPATTQREQVQQLQQQVKQTLDTQMQAPRDLPVDAK